MSTAVPSGSPATLSPRDREILLGLARRIDPDDAGGRNNLGVLYFDKGLIEEAVEQFHLALEADPGITAALRNLEIAYLASGLYERLCQRLGERLRQEPEDRAARWRLARAHRHTGHLVEAATELRRLLQATPADARLLLELGRVEKEAGAFESARRAYESALEVDPGSAVLHFHLGELHYHQGNSEEARRVLSRSIELAPDFAEAYHLLSFVLGDLGEGERATDALRRARELGPRLGEARTGLSIDRHSIARYTELIGDRRRRPVAVQDRFLAHYHLGIALRQKGLYEESLREFEQALARGEDAALVSRAKAEVLLVAGRGSEAAEIYRKLIEEDPNSPKLWNELGVCYHREGDLTRAADCYRRSLGEDREYVLAQNNLAIVLANRGDLEGAKSLLRRLLERRPRFAEALCNSGLLALEEGRRREALAAFRAVVEADPRSAAGWLGLGAVLSETGDLREARTALAHAVELAPRSAEARYRLGFLLNRIGDIEGSLRETELALGLNPYFTTSRPRLAIELHFEYAEVLAPELTTEVRLQPEEELPEYGITREELSGIFQKLRGGVVTPAPPPAADYGLARDYLSKGLFVRALAEVRRVGQAGGDPVDEALLSGAIFRLQNLQGEALERFEMAIARLPADSWTERHQQAYLGRGWCEMSVGRFDSALGASGTVRAHDPDSLEAALLEAEATLALGRAETALLLFTDLMERVPADAPLLTRIGHSARSAGGEELSRKALGRALELDPGLLAPRVELGSLCLAQGEYGAAAEHARSALDALPGYVEAALLLAEAENRRGRTREAISVLADLLADDPYHRGALLRLGELLLSQGQAGDALIPLRRLLRFDPAMGAAWLKLAEAYLEQGAEEDALACALRAAEAGADREEAARIRLEIDRRRTRPRVRRTA